MLDLRCRCPAEQARQGKRERDGAKHGKGAVQTPALQGVGDWSQNEAYQDGKDERQQDWLGEVQNNSAQHERLQRCECRASSDLPLSLPHSVLLPYSDSLS